jgi:voltage-gated potassium channel
MKTKISHTGSSNWQKKLHDVIYESNTTARKAFDITLLVFILASILVVMLDSVKRYHDHYGRYLIYWSGPLPFCLS